MQKLMTALFFALVFVLATLGVHAAIKESCNLTGEQKSGKNKICTYSCPSGAAAITVSDTQACPRNIVRTVS